MTRILPSSMLHRWVAADLTGSVADGGVVSSWAARTGGIALTGNASPTLVYGSNVGAQPAVRLNGTTQYFSGTLSSTLIPTIAAIVYITNIAPQQEVAWIGNTELLASGASQWQIWGSTAGLNSATETSAKAYVLVAGADSSATTDFITVNGTTVTGDAGTPNAGAGLFVGRYSTATRFFGGDIAEVMSFSTKLSTTEVAAIDSYAQDLYSIPVTDYLPLATYPPTPTARMRASDW